MYNAHKLICTGIAVAMTAALGSGCSSDQSETEHADSLLATARHQIDERQYSEAIVTLDSLDSSCRKCIAQRREGTVLRLDARQGLAYDSLATNEAYLQQMQAQADSLQKFFKFVEIAGTDGYFVESSIAGERMMASPMIQPRVDEKGYFFIAITLPNSAIGLNGLSYDSAHSLSGDLAVKEGNTEIMSLSQENISNVVEPLLNPALTSASITVTGTKANKNVKLDSKHLQALRRSWQLAAARQAVEKAQLRRDRFQSQITQLEDQKLSL